MSDFTVRDVDVLLEAVEEWEKKPSKDFLGGGLLRAMINPDHEAAKLRFEADAIAAEEQVKERRETSVLLQAKMS